MPQMTDLARLTGTLTLAVSAACAAPVSAPERPMHHHHTIDYIELPVSDMDAAKAFYGAAFGWTFNDYGPDYAGIVRTHGDGGPEVGGMRLEASVARGGPLVILYSADLEASVTAVEEAGGTVIVEPFEFPGGRRFQFTDPSGNELAVWSDK